MAIRVVSIISRMNVGGPAVLLSELIKNLPAEEFEHTLITGTCLDNEIDYLESHPMDSEVIYIDEIKRSILPLNDIKSFFKLIWVLRALKPDIVHTHTSKAGVLGRLAAKIAVPKARIIHTFHGHVLYGYFSPFKSSIIRHIEKVLGLITDEAVAITHPVKNDLIQAGVATKSRWHVIHPAVEPYPEKTTKVDDGVFRIMWVGRMAEIKNPLLALEAYKEFVGRFPGKSELIMIGAGDLLLPCKELARSNNLNVTFMGWLSDARPEIAQGDLLILTSINEGLGLVILEAAQCAIPTLATNVGGVSDFIRDGETGYFAESNPQIIGRHLFEIASDRESLAAVGKRASQLVADEFSLTHYYSLHIEMYRDAIKAP